MPQDNGPTSWLNMRKQMDKSKSVENTKKQPLVQPPQSDYADEDRPIVNNRFKKSQAMNESIQSIPQSSRGHNESRQSMSSTTRRRRTDRKKQASPEESQKEEQSPGYLKNPIDDIPIPVVAKKTFE